MRTLFLLITLIASYSCFGQKLGWQSLDQVSAPDKFENVYTHKVFGDSLSSSFLIFIKKEVKMHKHLHHSEHVYVLEGTADMLLGGIKISLNAGDLIFIPKNTPHSVMVTSDKVLKVLSVQSPFFDGSDRVILEE